MSQADKQSFLEFDLVDSSRWGYDVDAVDSFFERLAADFSRVRSGQREGVLTVQQIREVVFDQVRGGYDPLLVDHALDRVEDKFASFELARRKAELGQAAWDAETDRLAELIMGRLKRPAGERFRRPSQKLVKGYYMRDVDALCERLLGLIQSNKPLKLDMIRSASFRSASGDMSYEETQVDAFMDRCIELILELS